LLSSKVTSSCLYPVCIRDFLHVLHADRVDCKTLCLCATTSYSSACKFSITGIETPGLNSELTVPMLHDQGACCSSSEHTIRKSNTCQSDCCIQYAVITFSTDTVAPQSVCTALYVCYAQKQQGVLLQVHGHRGQARSNWLQAAA